MDGRGGCCIARYTADGGVYDLSKVDRIMLRYRPIAPKPTTSNESVSALNGKSDDHTKTGRGKKRCSKSSPKRCNRRRKENIVVPESKATLLPLLPETPIQKDGMVDLHKITKQPTLELPVTPHMFSPSLLSFSQEHHTQISFGKTPVQAAVRSCVTVECVTDTWIEGDGLGSNDREKQVQLAKDTCPGFISDSMGRVTWTNEAYRKMVNGEAAGVVVWLVMKERPLLTYPAFTCRVKVQYTCGKERSSVQTVPCDVWKMEGGGFAWRLDVKAALCLGR